MTPELRDKVSAISADLFSSIQTSVQELLEDKMVKDDEKLNVALSMICTLFCMQFHVFITEPLLSVGSKKRTVMDLLNPLFMRIRKTCEFAMEDE